MKPSKDLGRPWLPSWRATFFLLLSLFLCFACATKRYEGPFSGRSADSQLATSAALDKVISSTSLTALEGRRVWIQAFSLTERVGDQASPEESLLLAWFSEKLRREGAQVVERREDAEAHLSILARAIGVDVVRRDFPFLIYVESTRGRVDLHLVAFDPNGQILFTQDRQEKVTFREVYLFYLIGPFAWIR